MCKILSRSVVTASDLTTTIAGNLLCKYADDTYVIIPAQKYQSRSAELDNIETWAARNNLHLNRAKCAELIISEPRRRRHLTYRHVFQTSQEYL